MEGGPARQYHRHVEWAQTILLAGAIAAAGAYTTFAIFLLVKVLRDPASVGSWLPRLTARWYEAAFARDRLEREQARVVTFTKEKSARNVLLEAAYADLLRYEESAGIRGTASPTLPIEGGPVAGQAYFERAKEELRDVLTDDVTIRLNAGGIVPDHTEVASRESGVEAGETTPDAVLAAYERSVADSNRVRTVTILFWCLTFLVGLSFVLITAVTLAAQFGLGWTVSSAVVGLAVVGTMVLTLTRGRRRSPLANRNKDYYQRLLAQLGMDDQETNILMRRVESVGHW